MHGILHIHHVSLVVSDTARALDFYEGVLGLLRAERPSLGFPGAWLEAGGQQIHLLEVPGVDPVTGRPDHVGRDRHLALAVAALDAIVARLEAAGVEYRSSRSGRRAVFCRDPDGNGIELVETVSR